MSHFDWKVKPSYPAGHRSGDDLQVRWLKLWPGNITSLRSILISNMTWISESSPTAADICHHCHHGGGVLFSCRHPFLHRDCEILAYFGSLDADLRTFWYFYRLNDRQPCHKHLSHRITGLPLTELSHPVISVFVDSIVVWFFGNMTVDTGELLINTKEY